MSIDLVKAYNEKKIAIRNRLREFEKVWERQDNREIFAELCFCILTANASARMGLRSIEALGDILFKGSEEELTGALKGKHRFYNTRAKYIFETRENLNRYFNLDLISKINSFKDRLELRKFFAESSLIKGIGYKEASHFLRNIGFKGYAILDKHILNTMCRLNIICDKPKTLTPKKYLELEDRLKDFAQKIGIDFDELDLLIWSEQTGEILK